MKIYVLMDNGGSVLCYGGYYRYYLTPQVEALGERSLVYAYYKSHLMETMREWNRGRKRDCKVKPVLVKMFEEDKNEK